MKLKSLLFGSAAVMAAGTGVQAADLPTVEPVEYVRICDVFGTGFFYIPGTDTCLKIGGYVRYESRYVFGDEDDLEAFADTDEEEVNNWTSFARGAINVDARTQTEFGLIRAYVAYELNVSPSLTSEDSSNYAGTDPALAAAFIQISKEWGTYTVGHTGSFFDFFGGHGFGGFVDIDDNTTEQTLAAFTFGGGNGFSFTIAAEDPASSGRRRDGSGDDYEGQEYPDLVANVRVDQGWGSAQIMGVVHHVHDTFAGDDDGEIGFAVGGGLSIGIPGGWKIEGQGGYSEGAIGYLTNDPGGYGDWDGPDPEDLSEAYMFRGGITGNITSAFSVWLDGSYTHVEQDGDEYEFLAAKVGGSWSPASGLYMGPQFSWNSLEGDVDEEYDVFQAMWRVNRSF